MRKILLPLLLLVALCSGCAGKGFIGSFVGPMPEQRAIAAISADAVTCLSSLYPPGHTALHLLAAKQADNAFALAFERGLRSAGFTILADESPDGVTVAYTLDELEKGAAFYLQLRFSDGKAIARAYTASGHPEAGRSQAPFEYKRPLVKRAADKTTDTAKKAYGAVVETFSD